MLRGWWMGFLLVAAVGARASAQTCVKLPPDAIAWWSLDEPSGQTTIDRIDNILGAPTNGPFAVSSVLGEFSRYQPTRPVSETMTISPSSAPSSICPKYRFELESSKLK